MEKIGRISKTDKKRQKYKSLNERIKKEISMKKAEIRKAKKTNKKW